MPLLHPHPSICCIWVSFPLLSPSLLAAHPLFFFFDKRSQCFPNCPPTFGPSDHPASASQVIDTTSACTTIWVGFILVSARGGTSRPSVQPCVFVYFQRECTSIFPCTLTKIYQCKLMDFYIYVPFVATFHSAGLRMLVISIPEFKYYFLHLLSCVTLNTLLSLQIICLRNGDRSEKIR